MRYQINTTEEKVLNGEKLIQQNGGTIYANNTFDISGVSGKYNFEGGMLTIVITDKPWLASWDMIEEKINQFFG